MSEVRLIDANSLKKAIDTIKHTALTCSDNEPLFDYVELPDLIKEIDNAPTVEVPENAVNCVLTMFGNCSYNETGCSDCKIKDKIRKALEFAESQRIGCENCANRNRKSKEVCTSPYGACVFFEDKTQEGGAENER